MTGWIADFFRFWWALFYWNTRKTWFRLQGSHRDSCPCQHFNDSGHALDARCQAVELWQKPARFRQVCPLLIETSNGWRCSVDAERVRPFWGRALLFSGVTLLAIYLAGTVVVFAALRAVRYEVGYRSVVWPPSWSELHGMREKLHLQRAQQAINEGDFKAAILSLQTVCVLNPQNYNAALTLASLVQLAAQPSVADHIYARLMHDVPEKRTATAQLWGRALLAGGNYSELKPLALTMLTEDSNRREAWLHALLFSARQTRDQTVLRSLVHNEHGLPPWCIELVTIEQLLLEAKPDEALPRLYRINRQPEITLLCRFQVDHLLRLGRTAEASRLIDGYGSRLPAAEAGFLRIRAFRAQNWSTLLMTEAEALLGYPLSPRLAELFCASLIEQPAPEFLTRYLDRFIQLGPILDHETLPHYHATYLVAVLGGATAQADKLSAQINRFTASGGQALHGLGRQLRAGAPAVQINHLLPLVPLPVEVIYVIQQRATVHVAP